MKILKYSLYALLALVLLAVAAAAILALTFDPNQYKDEVEKLVKERTGRTLKFHGDVKLAFWPSLGVTVGKVTLSRRASEHDFAAFDSAHVSVGVMPLLRGQVAVDQVRIAGLRASVIRAKGGKFDFEDLMGAAGARKPAAPGAAPGKVQFDVAGIQIERGTLAYKDEGTGQTLEVGHLELRTGRIAEDVPGKMSLSALAKGKNPLVDLKIALESGYRLSPSRQEYALTGLSLRVDGAAAEFSRLALSLAGDVRADLAKENVSADLTAKFDETTIKAKAAMTKFAAPHYGFDVDVDKINLDRYLVASPKAKPAPGAGAKVDVDVPVDLSGLKGLSADGKLAVGALQVQGLKLTEVRTQLRAAGGRAELAPHSAKLYEGTLAGALTLNASGNRIALKEALSNVAIGPLVKDAAGRDALEGRGNIALDVTAAGDTVNAMKKALAGTARVALRDGALKGINLTEALRKTRAAFGSKSAQQQPSDTAQRTDFSEMTASFVIKNGVARNDDLDVKAPVLRLGGAGDIDIGNSRLNYVAKATVVATSKGQGGADLDHLAGLTIPVKLTGPFDAPKYEIDYGALASQAAKAKAAEKVQEKLKDLLRRR
ncbi:MAG TPA: AsmA family protein [Burkholderiales bacterium]|nr:AsmA family protein [Burkholderiales bacterium]